jgi:hypothetical protein
MASATPGYNKTVTFFVSGGSAATLKITKHSWKESVDKLDVTDTGHAGVQALIAGILRGDGTVEGNVRPTELINDTAPGVIVGAKGVITFNFGAATNWSCPVLITDVNWQSTVQGFPTWNFNVSLDSDSGTYTRGAETA